MEGSGRMDLIGFSDRYLPFAGGVMGGLRNGGSEGGAGDGHAVVANKKTPPLLFNDFTLRF